MFSHPTVSPDLFRRYSNGRKNTMGCTLVRDVDRPMKAAIYERAGTDAWPVVQQVFLVYILQRKKILSASVLLYFEYHTL